MALKDSLQAGPRPIDRGIRCGITLILGELDDEDRGLLQAAIDDPRWTAVGLSELLKSEGYHIGPQSINRHRRNVCTCAARR